MATGTKRTRLIVVDGQRFRWRCNFNYPLEVLSSAYAAGRITTPDRLLVRPEATPNRLLTVEWPPCYGPVVKPSVVRTCIDEAVRRGWPGDVPSIDLLGSDFVQDRRSTA